ncbi:hypothetical protein A2U01_0105786, partial [Trifolium medium]|nr:hypothetical protein [Trifolium medium]
MLRYCDRRPRIVFRGLLLIWALLDGPVGEFLKCWVLGPVQNKSPPKSLCS